MWHRCRDVRREWSIYRWQAQADWSDGVLPAVMRRVALPDDSFD
ncbi:MAG: hypothetical protein ACOC7K_00945 [bacterium]